MSGPPFLPGMMPLGQYPPFLPQGGPPSVPTVPGILPPIGHQVTSSSYGYYYSAPQLYGATQAFFGFDVYGQTATASEAKSVNNLASAIVGYQMGASVAHDHVGEERVTDLRQSHILLVDCSAGVAANQDPRTKLMIESLGAAMVAQVSLELLQQSTALNANTRTIVLLGAPRHDSPNFVTPTEAAIHRLQQFVKDGGHLISIGNTIHYVQSIFGLSDVFEISNRYILQKLPTRIQVAEEKGKTEEEEEWKQLLFSGFGKDSFVVLEPNNVLVKILDPTKAEVLCTAKEIAKKLGIVDTLVFRIRKDKGLITHMTSTFCRKKKLHVNMQQGYEKELRKEHASEPTIKAWKFAAEMGFSDSFWEADAAVGFQQFLLGIIISNPVPTPKPVTSSSSSSSSATPSSPSEASSKISTLTEEDGPIEVKKEGETDGMITDESALLDTNHTNGSSSTPLSPSKSETTTAMVTGDSDGKEDNESEDDDE